MFSSSLFEWTRHWCHVWNSVSCAQRSLSFSFFFFGCFVPDSTGVNLLHFFFRPYFLQCVLLTWTLRCLQCIQSSGTLTSVGTWTLRTVVTRECLRLRSRFVVGLRLYLRFWGQWGPTSPSACWHALPTSSRRPRGPPLLPESVRNPFCRSSTVFYWTTVKRCPKGWYKRFVRVW